MTVEDLLTLAEVARILQVGKIRAWQLLKEGKLTGIKRGRDWFIRPSSVRDLVKSREEKKSQSKEKKAS